MTYQSDFSEFVWVLWPILRLAIGLVLFVLLVLLVYGSIRAARAN